MIYINAANLDRMADRLWWKTLVHRLNRRDEMPEIGGSKLASDFASMMADVRKAIEDSKQSVAGAVLELKTEIVQGGQQAAKAIRTEAATVRAGWGQLLGNGGPAIDDTQSATTGSPPAVAPVASTSSFHHDTGDPVR